MKDLKKMPALSLLALIIHAQISCAEEFDLNFLHEVGLTPAILKTDSHYPAGEYFVDVTLNNENTGKEALTISSDEEKADSLCLNSQWLKDAGILFQSASYEKFFNREKNCYRLGDEPNTNVEFDYGAQALNISIPQAYLLSKTDSTLWDYGTNGVRLTYSGNFNKNSHSDVSAFGHFNLGVNIGRWILSGVMNVSRYDGKNEFSTNDLSLSTAISQIKGDLILGRSQTRTNLFSDFGFYGVALRSNSNMRSWATRGYAPVITGIADSQSRITITQGGYTVYSKVVPAGPYRLDDVSPVSNGDLVVTVENESGRKTETIYPVATLPSLLRPGEFEYNLAAGRKNNGTELKDAFSSGDGTFFLGSLNYGFATTTMNSAFIFHDKYKSAGLGVTQSLGAIGAVEASYITARAQYNNGDVKSGNTFNVKYAKSFSANTDLQLLTYRYQSKDYVDFSNFDANNVYRYGQQKSRYEARLSHRFERAYLSGAYWQQNFWQQPGYEKGATISTSTSFGDISLYLNGSYSKHPYSDKPDYSMSLSMSVPFNLGGIRHYSNSSVGYNRYSGTSFNTGVSATVNDRLNYSLNSNVDSKGNKGASGSVSYAFDALQTNLSLSQNNSQTSVSGSFSGSAIATAETGVLLTKETSGTIGVVNIAGIEGVTFNNSLPTDRNGNTVVYLSEYSPNVISVNMDNVPDDAEITKTSYNVVPTEHAIIYRKFDAQYVKRYILRVKNAQGKVLNGGNAETDNGLNAGFISNNGVLLMNMLTEPQRIRVRMGDGMQCGFSMAGIHANTNKVQEVRCE